MTAADRDALVHAIGRAIVADPAAADGDWDGYALVADYAGGSRRLSGFRYRDGEAPRPATPRSPALESALDALREATRTEDKDPWTVCIVRIQRTTAKVGLEFAYDDDAAQWQVTPARLGEVAERARPRG